MLTEFEARLKVLLEELFSPDETFKQTQNAKTCKFCNFKNMCYRQVRHAGGAAILRAIGIPKKEYYFVYPYR